MNEALEKIRQEALARLQEVREEKELEELNSSVLGRSGSLTGILRTMGQLDKEQRAKLGQASNAVKKELEQAIAERRAKIAQLMQQKAFEKETLDVTEPGIRRQPSGRLHPMTQTYREIRDALIGMGSLLRMPPICALNSAAAALSPQRQAKLRVGISPALGEAYAAERRL